MGRASERCQGLPGYLPNSEYFTNTWRMGTNKHLQLHENQEHPDRPLLVHAKELTDQLEKLGIHSSPVEDDEEDDGGQAEEYWEDDSDDDDQMVS
jgi:hypothetical protein